ncbi:ABC transporter ATP-binding protein [Hamadaea tsunoensis]|uniref:ABC transporter ATP-binding protein n=1 Tax=Hamadaea tsunoensis TaxID=53368 RepID=UPI00041E9D37|nr:ABC transporter ATP-binding protein [Hamadaea tsunoensis]
MTVIAQLDHVTKTYGQVVALDAVSLTVPAGVTAVLGPNGAGKSTMIEILAGLRSPSGGQLKVLGGDPTTLAIKARIGLTPQRTALPWRLTVAETLDLIGAHYPAPIPRSVIVETLGLGAFLNKRNGTLSGGQRRRVALGAALIGAPDLLFLDEPTTGLDTDSRNQLWSAISAVAAQGRSVLLTTHDMIEAEHLAENVIVIAGGQVAREGEIEEVIAQVGLHLVEADVPEGTSELTFATVHAERVERIGSRVRIYTADPDATVRALVVDRVPFRGIRVDRVGLEEAIRAITATDADAPVSPAVGQITEKVAR